MGSVNTIDQKELDSLRKLIIGRLAGGVSREDITLEICERSGLVWPEAQWIVNKVEEENAEVISKRQFPLIGGISVFFSIAGLLMAIWGTTGLVTLAIDLQKGVIIPESMYPASNVPAWINTMIEQMGIGIKLFQLQFILSYVEFLIIGILLTLSGYLSMRQTLNLVIEDLISWIKNR